jgi:hypothetical protein
VEATRIARAVALSLLGLWALLFLTGALGELLDIDALRRVSDVKRIFLR